MILCLPDYSDNTVSFIGNGRMLVTECGAEIRSVQSGYSSPCFISMVPDRLYESESTADLESGAYLHKLFFPDSFIGSDSGIDMIPDVSFTDVMYPDCRAFIRHAECMKGMDLKLITPGYAKVNLFKKYKLGGLRLDALTVRLPAGVEYCEGLVTGEEKRIIVFTHGGASLYREGIRLDQGDSDIVIVCGDPDECVSNAIRALHLLNSFSSAEELLKIPGRRLDRVQIENDDPLILEPLASLISRQAESGGVIASDQLPLADAGALADLVEVFGKLGLKDRSKKLIDYYEDLYSDPSVKSFGTFSSLEKREVIPDVDPGRSAACLLKGFMAYYENAEIGRTAARIMKSAFYTAASSIKQGMVQFSGAEEELTSGVIPLGYIDQASADSTIEVMAACRAFLDFAKRNRLRLKDDASGLKTVIDGAFDSFEKLFISDGRVCENSFRLTGITKNKRFIYSRCPVCRQNTGNSPLKWLERTKNSGYLCPECFEKGAGTECDMTVRIPSVKSEAKAVYYGLLKGDAFDRACAGLIDYAKRLTNDARGAPLRSSLTDVWVFKALKRIGADVSDYRGVLADLTDSECTLSSMISGSVHIGRRADSASTACLLAEFLK